MDTENIAAFWVAVHIPLLLVSKPMKKFFMAACLLALTSKCIQAQSVILNGDFSSGLDDWTVVQPPDNTPVVGTLGQIQFANESFVSEAFTAQVGYNQQQNLEQTISLSAGIQYNFQADVAAVYPLYNLDGGTITLSIGGNNVTSISFGPGLTQYGTLDGSYIPGASGDELLVLNFYRSYQASSESPTDYIGNISMTPVPEPTGLCSLGLGSLFALYSLKKKRSA